MVDAKLYTLLEVSDCLSFQEAARRLSVTQPAVSHHIKLLEEELGVRIFDRRGGRVSLTPEGEETVLCAKKIAALYRNLQQTLTDRAAMASHLTVGLTRTEGSGAVAVSLARYGARDGRISIKIITDTIQNLYSMLKAYEIDLAVVEGRVPDEEISYLPLDTDHLVLAVPVGHPLSRQGMATLDQLKRERMILRLPNSGTRNLFLANLESNHTDLRELNVVLELDDIDMIKELVRLGLGVSILPRSVCVEAVREKKIAVLPVENISMTREINIAYHRDFSRMELLRGLVRAYHETLEGKPLP